MYLETETVSVVEAGKRLGLGKTGAYQAIAAGEIPHRHFGHRIRVSVNLLERLTTDETYEPAPCRKCTPEHPTLNGLLSKGQ